MKRGTKRRRRRSRLMHSALDLSLAYPWRPMSRSRRDRSRDLIQVRTLVPIQGQIPDQTQGPIPAHCQDLIPDQTPDPIQDQSLGLGLIPDPIQDRSLGQIPVQTLDPIRDPIRDQATPMALGTPTDLDTRTVFRVMSTSAPVRVMRTRDRPVTRTHRATPTSNRARM
jgi:hypothetical protein